MTSGILRKFEPPCARECVDPTPQATRRKASRFLLRLLSGMLAMAVTSASLPAKEDEWTSLFDGKTFTGWKQLGGKGKFEVRDGTIVGIVTANVFESSFLATEAEFGDFVFACEFRADPGINSGVQFRSRRATEKVKSVHGYQYEIDATPRALTGGLYEESRRGWLAPSQSTGGLRDAWNQAHGDRLKAGEWNTIRIEARGARIRTWLNERLLTDFEDQDDTRFRRGIFALQVHSTRNAALFGKEVAFRHLRVQKLD